MTTLAVVCAMLAGCTATSPDGAEVDVLAEVLEREVPAVDDAPDGDEGDTPRARRDADGSDEGDDDGRSADAAATPGGDTPAGDAAEQTTGPPSAGSEEGAGSPPADGTRTSPPATTPPPAPRAAARPAPAPEPRPGPRPTPPPPAPRTLGSGEVISAGVLTSTDGSWVETSGVAFERGADPEPFVIDLRVAEGEADAQQVGCVPRLVAPDDRGLVVRGEILVSVVTETADEVVRQPRVRIPLDVELAAGEELELPASRPLTVHHGETDARISCLAVLTAR